MNAEPERLLAGLDPEQREVATSFGGPVAVIAGAGTGKTRALTHRIAYGVATGAYRPQSVLALTFTTRAAGELRTRLRDLGLPGVQGRTFHSAALRQAQYFWPRAYGTELPQVSEDRIGILAAAARTLRLAPDSGQLRDLLTEVSWAKVSNILAGDYAELATRAGREVAGLEPAQVGRLLGVYERVKADRGVIDFDDILLCTVALLAENADVAEEVRATYRHLLVDEYQDVSPLQQTLLDAWLGGSGDHCVVGDPAQTIHSFAGASPVFLNTFSIRFPDARVIRLVRDYRSTPQVVALANTVAAANRLGSVQLRSQQPDGPEPRVLACPDEPSEAVTVARWLVEQHEAGVRWRDQAVLYRLHAQSPLFEAELAQAGVPFVVRGGEGFYARDEVRQAIAALSRAAQQDAGVPAVDACRAVLERLGWSAQAAPNAQGRVRERWESLAAVLALAEDLASARPGVDLAALVAELTERAQAEHPLSADGVTLSTLHAAKGLEWTAVAIVGAQDGTLPLSLARGPEQLAEEARLCYVGITRAASALLITWSRSRRGGSGSGIRQLSRFLDAVQTVARAGQAPRRRPVRTVATELSARCRVCGTSLVTGADRKLGRHADCPANYDEATHAALVEWRAKVAAERSLPGFCVFTDATLLAIAEAAPTDLAGLSAIPGVGRSKLEQYGADVLAILVG